MTVETRLSAFLVAADAMLDLLRHPAVRERWAEPSALDQMSVGDLAAHLGSQPVLVAQAATRPPDDEQPVPLLEHYARSAWVGAALDDDANVGIRESAQQAAAVGPDQLLADIESAMAQLRATDPTTLPPTARMPWWQWSLSFDDFLVVRSMETVVHTDDLVASLGVEPVKLPEDVLEPVLTLLVMLSVRRNGQAAVVRALARRERADRPVNAF
jgi:hypothetical protein